MPNYNTFYPTGYQPYYGQQQYQQQMQPNQFMQQQPMQSQQAVQQAALRQNEFIRVRSKEEAKNYPVAPGNSVTFINESAPYCYVKTMGASQLDRPTFEVYRLVKEDTDDKSIEENEKQSQNTLEELRNDIMKLQKDVDSLNASVKTLKEKKPAKKVILQEADDE